MTTRRNGPVKTFVPDGGDDRDPSQAARQAPVGGLTGFGFKLEAIAPAKGKGDKVTAEATPIEWPEDIARVAKQLGVILPDVEPGKGKSPSGHLVVAPKGSPWKGRATIPTVGDLPRRDAAAVWAAWLAHGANGSCPSMAVGDPLPLLDCFRSLIGSGFDGAAFKVLWAGSGSRTSILGMIAAHTGRTACLDLATFQITLI